MSAKVSVIIPTQNRAKLLPRAIDSVLSQSFKDFELIIINDGSTDGTNELLKKYQSEDSRIRVITYDSPQGIPIVRNRGMTEATGKYIAWQDDDDEWLPKKLEKQVENLDRLPPDYGIVYTGYWRIRKNGKKVYFPPKWVKPTEGDLYRVFLKKNFLCMQAMLQRKEVFEQVGGFELEYPVLQEYDWFPRVAKKFKFAYIPEPLLILHHTPGSNSQNSELNAFVRKMFVKKYNKDLKKFGFLGYHYGIIGDLLADAKQYNKASYNLFRAAFHNPLHLTYWVEAILSSLHINHHKLKVILPFVSKRKKFDI